MSLRALSFTIVSIAFGVAFSAQAAIDSSFTVKMFLGEDTTPPSIPVNVTAIPVAATQIDLSWDSSTDDVLLSGYQVFRDDVQIGTTTLTTYSDVGLAASTTYAYYITAFDFFNNISASSTVVATTTLAATPTSTPPADEVDTGTRYGSIVRLSELTALEIIPSQYGVMLRYETDGYVRSIVRYGLTSSYELGSIVERAFSKTHETIITDLLPNTTYTFTIEGYNRVGVFGVLTESTFTTLPLDVVVPPTNVTDLRAVRVGDDIVLTWQNPYDTDFDRVRVLRSDQFYPSDTADGWVVYEDDGESVRDTGAAEGVSQLFYTVFTYDSNGWVSSGAVVSIRLTNVPLPPGEGTIGEVVDDKTPVNTLGLTLDQIILMQEGRQIPFVRGTALIDGTKHLSISIPYDTLPERLKTILVTLTSGIDREKELNFLLRVNAEKTAYVARLAPLGVSGDFPLRVTVFDFKTTQIGYTNGRITSEIVSYEELPSHTEASFFGGFIDFVKTIVSSYLFWFILFLLVLLLIARALMRSKEK